MQVSQHIQLHTPILGCWCLSRQPNCQAASVAACLTGVLCRAFALEGRGIWHALSASITQQVIGPVRARADFRYALDLPSSIPQVTDCSALHLCIQPDLVVQRCDGNGSCPANSCSMGPDLLHLQA